MSGKWVYGFPSSHDQKASEGIVTKTFMFLIRCSFYYVAVGFN